MRINFLKHGTSVLVLVFFGFLVLGCGTTETAVMEDTPSAVVTPTVADQPQPEKIEINYKKIPLEDMKNIGPTLNEREGVIVEAYIKMGNNFTITISNTPAIFDGVWYHKNVNATVWLSDFSDQKIFGGSSVSPDTFNSRIDFEKIYSVYMTFDDPYNNKKKYFYITNIDGLFTKEEAVENVARRQEAERLVREVKQKAIEEANRYDPAKFIIVPANFKPVDYTKADLFDAAAAANKLRASEYDDIFGRIYSPSKEFVSDVFFVSQNGTYITFRTADNAISRTMLVDARTGLNAGQKIRIYYSVYRVKEWQIHAIERL
jgi:hypothetical protein